MSVTEKLTQFSWFISEANACERGNDICSENGICTNVGPSYTCSCKAGFVDQNPSLPGTACQSKKATPYSEFSALYNKGVMVN